MISGGAGEAGTPVSLVHRFYQTLTQSASRSAAVPATNEKAANTPVEEFRVFLWSIARLGLIIAYFYVCDRTTFFMKESK